jgi:hypothetical protein
MASLVAYCIAGFFLSQAYSAFLYSLLGMVVGLSVAVSNDPSANPVRPIAVVPRRNRRGLLR